jgi:hypothetical protein
MKDKKNAKAMWLETESPPLYLWEKQQASLASKDIPWDIAGSHEELRFNYEVGSLAASMAWRQGGQFLEANQSAVYFPHPGPFPASGRGEWKLVWFFGDEESSSLC